MSTMAIPYHYKSDEEIFFVFDNKPYTYTKSHSDFYTIVAHVQGNNQDDLREIFNRVNDLVVATNGFFKCTENGHVYYNKSLLTDATADLIYDKLKNKTERQAWYNMLDKIAQNPRQDIMHEIILWIEEASLAIFDDGDILAFKKVNDNYTSIHDSRTMNALHTTISLPREQCDDSRKRTCSSGLHFCSYGYLDHFSGSGNSRVLILKINPRDIVAIPEDYNNQKGRACSYYIWGEIGEETHSAYSEETTETVSAEKPQTEVKQDIVDKQRSKENIKRLYDKHGSFTAAGKEIGISRKVFARLYKGYGLD